MGGFWSDNSSTPSASPVCGVVDLNTQIRSGGDYISLIYTSCPSEGAYSAFESAAARWNRVIEENGVRPAQTRNGFDANDMCTFLETDYAFEAGHVFDHLTIVVEPVYIDGKGGVLAAAAPCAYDNSEYSFPILGGMRFDSADLDSLEASGTLEDVITHEMAHVLGLGTLWQKEGLSEDVIFKSSSNVRPDKTPKYVGEAGLAAFNGLANSNVDFVPLEDGKGENGAILMDTTRSQGQGSVDVHWKKTVFDDELMTYSIRSNVEHPISAVSLHALVDLGYVIDDSTADLFSFSSAHNRMKSTLSTAVKAKQEAVFDLGGDVLVFDKSNVMPLEDALTKSRLLR